MMSTRTFEQRLAKILRQRRARQYDLALSEVEKLLAFMPGNAQLHVLRACLIQLTDKPTHSLDEAKKALQRAAALDKTSPAAAVELGYYLDNVADDPEAASKVFAEGVQTARSLLIDSLIGHARALLQLEKREDALKCLMEALYLANMDSSTARGKSAAAAPDVLLRDPTGSVLAIQLKGPFAMKIEDLLQELFPKRSA
jgi:tetratricopeptide (TPR) repeat protein